jgi:hypothetical protein
MTCVICGLPESTSICNVCSAMEGIQEGLDSKLIAEARVEFRKYWILAYGVGVRPSEKDRFMHFYEALAAVLGQTRANEIFSEEGKKVPRWVVLP